MLTENELNHFKGKLTEMKHKMTEMVDANEPLTFEDYGELSSMGNHFADTASQLEDREVQKSMKDAARHFLEEIDAALERIENGTYGKCVDTGKDIPVERLEAIPYAKRTVEAQQKHDEDTKFIPPKDRSFVKPKEGSRGEDQMQAVDRLQVEHENSSYRK